jgi:hypothetical protein
MRTKPFFLLACLLLVQNGYSQTIMEFTYYDDGSRHTRNIITLKSGRIDTSSIDNGNLQPSVMAEQFSNVDTNKFLEEKTDEFAIKIFPNPTKGQLLVYITGVDQFDNSSISVFSSKGILLNKIQPIGSTTTIDLFNNESGIYVLIIQIKNKSSSWKILKE